MDPGSVAENVLVNRLNKTKVEKFSNSTLGGMGFDVMS